MRINQTSYPQNLFVYMFGTSIDVKELYDEYIRVSNIILKPNEQECIKLYFEEHKTYKEIGQILNVSPTTPNNIIRRARYKIQHTWSKNKSLFMSAAFVQLCMNSRLNKNQPINDYFEQLKANISYKLLLDEFSIQTVDEFQQLGLIKNLQQKIYLSNLCIKQISKGNLK